MATATRTRRRILKIRQQSDSDAYYGNPKYPPSLTVLTLMRGGEVSLTAGAKKAGIRPETARRYIGSALELQPNGRYRAKRWDRLRRPMRFLTAQGEISIETADSRHAKHIGRYWSALKAYLEGRRPDLKEFEGKGIRTFDGEYLEFIADLELVEWLAQAGELAFEDLYRGTG